MNLELYLRILWRFRLLAILGVLLASTLAILAVARVSLDGGIGLEHRQSELWVSRATLLITEPQFPEGRAVFKQSIPPLGTDKPQDYAAPFADPGRFVALANLYAQLATSDQVRQIMLKDGPVKGTIESAPVATVNGAASLPLLSIGAISTSPNQARRLTKRAVTAFLTFLQTQQQQSGTPKSQRVLLQVIKQPTRVELLRGRPKTLPLLVFLTVLLAVGGLIFVLENMRPRVVSPLPSEEARPSAENVLDRRSA